MPSIEEKVELACRILAKKGLMEYLGHVSGRLEGEEGWMAIKKPPDPLIHVNLEGRVRDEADRPWLPAEIPIHTEIYKRRPDVKGIVHIHPYYAVALSAVGRVALPLMGEGLELAAEGIPLYDDPGVITTVEQGKALADALGGKRTCVIKDHGIVAVGKSVEEATINAINLELMSKITHLALQVGEPQPFPSDKIERFMKSIRADEEMRYRRVVKRAWDYFVAQLQG